MQGEDLLDPQRLEELVPHDVVGTARRFLGRLEEDNDTTGEASGLRMIGIELQMVPVRTSVNIAGPDFMAVAPNFGKQPIEAIEDHLKSATKSMLDELAWWAKATAAAKVADS